MPLEKFFLHKKDIDELFQKGIIKDMYDLIGAKGKIRYGFVGFTYRVIDKKTKFFQTGLSFAPHPNRLNYYLRDCVFKPKKYLFRRTGENQIYGWIAEAIDEAVGLQTFKDKINDGNIKSLTDALSDFLEFEVTGIFWVEKLVRLAEDEQIAVSLLGTGRKGLRKLVSSLGLGYDLVNPASLNMKKIIEIQKRYGISKGMIGMGLNDPMSSGKSGKPKRIEKFIWNCAYYTALGMSGAQMYIRIKKRGLYIKSLSAFAHDYRVLFGSVKQGRKIFLNPIIKTLKEVHGYSQGEINKLYPIHKTFDKEQFIRFAENNYDRDEIARKMGFSFSVFMVYVNDLIDQEYDFIEQYINRGYKKRKTFEDLSYYLVAQKILHQALNNIPKSDILNSFEKRLGDYKFSSIIKKVFKVRRWTALVDIAREELLSAIILDINPAKIKEITKDKRCWILFSLIRTKLILFYDNNPLVQYVISKGHKLNSLELGKVAIIGVELEKFYKLGYSDSLILNKLGSSYSLQDIIEITKLIWDTDPDGARKLLHTGLLSS